MTTTPIHLQLLLRSEHRNRADVEFAAALLQQLGLTVTGTGAATVSVTGSQEEIAGVFGAALEAALQVPDPLAPLIESVSIPPPHEYL